MPLPPAEMPLEKPAIVLLEIAILSVRINSMPAPAYSPLEIALLEIVGDPPSA